MLYEFQGLIVLCIAPKQQSQEKEKTMTYVDGIMCAVPTAKRDEYVEFAELMAKLFEEYGALQVVDG